MPEEVESNETLVEENSYLIRPNFQHKFKPITVKECIHSVLSEELHKKDYVAEEVPELTKTVANKVEDKLKELGYDRYKFVVQVFIGEQRGAGVKMACRCFWDSDTDNYAQDIYTNSSLFCVCAAFGLYFY